jgi:5-methylcytosine-specific restriction protein A
LRFFHEADGMVTMHGKFDAQTAAPVRAWIDAEVRRALNDQRGLVADEQRTPAQAAADALAAMARHLLGCEDPAAGPKTTLVVRVGKDALESGLGLAECDGLEAPVSVAALRTMAVDAEVVPAVMGGDSLPLDVGRARRLFTRAQRLALAERDGGCAKCGAPVARCDVHHIRWWLHGGRSDLDNGVLLCVGCHHRLHDFGWGIEVRDGAVWFIPPATVDPDRTPQRARRSHAEEDRHLTRSARLVAA